VLIILETCQVIVVFTETVELCLILFYNTKNELQWTGRAKAQLEDDTESYQSMPRRVGRS
jgi:hypothetical protein